MKICKIYNSRMDIYGNRYWAFEFVDGKADVSVSAFIRGGLSNIESAVRGLADYCHREELPIREFNRRAKGLPCAGCGVEDIATWIKKALRAERKKLKES